MIGVTIVAILELSSGIIAACIPACVPIFRFRKIKAERLQAKDYASNSGYHSNTPRTLESGKGSAIRLTTQFEISTKNKSEEDLVPLK